MGFVFSKNIKIACFNGQGYYFKGVSKPDPEKLFLYCTECWNDDQKL